MRARPVVGVTMDIELRPEGKPPRDFYFLDARVFPTLVEAGTTPIMLPNEFALIENYLDAIDGLFVSGGGYQFKHAQLFAPDAPGAEPPEKWQRTRFELGIIQAAVRRDMPVFAICGGMQTLNVALGGAIEPRLDAVKPDWARHRQPPYDSACHAVHVTPGSLLTRLTGTDSFMVNSLHRQGVVQAAPGSIASGMADDGVVEAVERADRRFCLGVQWHPEFYVGGAADRALFTGFAQAAAGADLRQAA